MGHLNLGLSHDTSRFACDSFGYWWETHSRPVFPYSRRMLLFTCDGGGQQRLQPLRIQVPPGTFGNASEFGNPRGPLPAVLFQIQVDRASLFPTRNPGRARTVVDLARGHSVRPWQKASTKQGPQKTTVNVLPGDYHAQRRLIPKNTPKCMKIRFDEELPAWNHYRAVPDKCDS